MGAKDSALRTPLHYAVAIKNWRAVEELLSLGAGKKEDLPNRLNDLAYCTVRAGQVDCVRAFVAASIDFHTRGVQGSTILHEAFSNEKTYFATARYILEQEEGRRIVNAKCSGGSTPLHALIRMHTALSEDPNWRKMFKLLLQCSADIHAKSYAGGTPVHHLVGWNNRESSILGLIPACFDFNIKAFREETILHSAVRGRDEMLQNLLKLEGGKLAVNVPDDGGSTPLHLVAWYQNTEKVELLLRFGADAWTKDDRGNMPLIYAKRRGPGTPSHTL